MMTKRKALGKGLSALIPDAKELAEGYDYFQCPVEEIQPNPYQPRQRFDDEDFEGLVRSVKEKGIVTPILVSRSEKGYQLIAGERRWKAAQKAGLDRVPVVVRETTPIESLELALIENIHRRDLNPIEEATAYQRWLEDTKTTQEDLAQRLGKERSTITNLMRLLKLPKVIQKDLIEGKLSMGHGRVLAGLKNPSEQRRFRDLTLKKALSVRQLEEMVKERAAPKSAQSGKRRKTSEQYYLESLAEDLKRSLGTKVNIRKRGKIGNIVIHFYSDEELDRLLDLLT
jgi:ParB family chromosome partitioning protein